MESGKIPKSQTKSGNFLSQGVREGVVQSFVWIQVEETHLRAGPDVCRDGREPTSRHKVRKCAAKSH